MTEKIKEQIEWIKKKENVRILYAAESGSRAWGFPSPDSDYDVRFVYVRPVEDYLKLVPVRDVIEYPIDDLLDINGWDLRKALTLHAKGNATVFEWDGSPIVYKTSPEWEMISRVLPHYFSERELIYHYYGTAMHQYNAYMQEPLVKYKKYFYSLRPLLAARYIEEKHEVPPVLFDELLKLPMEESLRNAIDELLVKKAKTRETDLNPQIPEVLHFIEAELVRQKQIADSMPDDRNHDWSELDDLLLTVLMNDKSALSDTRRRK